MDLSSGEPIQPRHTPGIRRVRRWRKGHISHWACQHVTLAELADGRWLVEHATHGARTYPDRAQAEAVATRMTNSSEWVEVPAAYGPDGQPVGPGWVRRGGTWQRDS